MRTTTKTFSLKVPATYEGRPEFVTFDDVRAEIEYRRDRKGATWEDPGWDDVLAYRVKIISDLAADYAFFQAEGWTLLKTLSEVEKMARDVAKDLDLT